MLINNTTPTAEAKSKLHCPVALEVYKMFGPKRTVQAGVIGDSSRRDMGNVNNRLIDSAS